MGTKINLYKQSGTDDGTSVNFNVPRSLTYGLNARANDDGGVTESDNCEYNILNTLYGINYEPIPIQPETAAYLAATGITGTTEVNAINKLVYELKQNNLWSKMKAVYPFVTDNRNLVGYTEDFSNSAWAKIRTTVSPNTTTAPNGTLTADTLLDGTASGSHAVSTFKTAFGQNGNNTSTIYAKANTLNYLWMYFYNGSEPGGVYAFFNLSNGTVGTVQSGITANIESVGNGWYRCSITRNFNFTAANSNCGYGVSNADNVISYLGTNQSIYIWGAQLELGSTATTYQPIATTQQAFISSQFKYNLVNPVDSDAAFRLVFNGGWTHSSNGATPNGTNGYADTKFNASTNFNSSSRHMSYYNRTNTAKGYDMGCYLNPNDTMLSSRYTGTTSAYTCYGTTVGGYTTAVTATAIGFTQSSNISSSEKLYKNGTSIASRTRTITSINLPIFIGASNINSAAGEYTNHQCAFSSIGDGLSDTEAANLYTRVQAFQTQLFRAV
jgi:hypothetical protein